MVVAQHVCYSSRLLRRCHEAPVGICQYCGRPFCAQHGDTLAQGQQVCHGQRCQRKVEDLAGHRAYAALVAQRNAQQMCGLYHCTRELWGQCSHCQAFFCSSHLHPRLRSVRREGLSVQEPVSLCDHCWRRHQLWAEW